jgi:hypothetical protein
MNPSGVTAVFSVAKSLAAAGLWQALCQLLGFSQSTLTTF